MDRLLYSFLRSNYPRKMFYFRAVRERLRFYFMHVFRNTIPVPPLSAIEVEINAYCNRKCHFCPISTVKREIAYLEEELFFKIVGDLKAINFSGEFTFNMYNEPLLDKRLPQFIAHVRQELPSVFIYLNTNGDALSLDLWNKLREAGLDYCKISQYDGKISDKVQAIEDKLSSKEKRHFHALVFDTKYAWNRGGLVKGRDVLLPLKTYCARPFFQFNVNYKGKAVLCCNDFHGVVEIGDLRDESVAELWRSKIFKHYRERLFLKDRASLKLCQTCDCDG